MIITVCYCNLQLSNNQVYNKSAQNNEACSFRVEVMTYSGRRAHWMSPIHICSLYNEGVSINCLSVKFLIHSDGSIIFIYNEWHIISDNAVPDLTT